MEQFESKGNIMWKNTAMNINVVWSCRKDGGQQDPTQSVTVLH